MTDPLLREARRKSKAHEALSVEERRALADDQAARNARSARVYFSSREQLDRLKSIMEERDGERVFSKWLIRHAIHSIDGAVIDPGERTRLIDANEELRRDRDELRRELSRLAEELAKTSEWNRTLEGHMVRLLEKVLPTESDAHAGGEKPA